MKTLDIENKSASKEIFLEVNYKTLPKENTKKFKASNKGKHNLKKDIIDKIHVDADSNKAMTNNGGTWSFSKDSISVVAQESGSH